jgi:hypothetical protein
MNAAIEIRKIADGKIQARRLDGKPLTPEDREAAKRIAARELASMATNRPERADDPILSVEQWYPEFHRFHTTVVAETPDFDYGWLSHNRPDLYRQIKAKEDQIDGLDAPRLSKVMAVMREWRELILTAEFERKQAIR